MGRGHHGSIARRATGLCVGLFLLGCTEFEPGTDELEASTERLDQLPPGVGSDWSCLGSVPPGTNETELGAPITYTVRLLDLGTRSPVPNMRIRVCGLTDVDCVMPVADVAVDPDGWVDIPLTENFSGYLELLSPSTVPSAFYLGEGLHTMTEYPFLVVTEPSLQGLVAATGVGFIPTAGTISVRTLDCQSNTAPNIAVTNTTGGVTYYFANGLPDPTPRATDGDGIAGFINVPPGLTTLQARLADGTVIDSRSFIVRPNWIMTAFMRPAGFQAPAPLAP
jgi:hypothetical protein